MGLSVIVSKKEFLGRFDQFERTWCKGFNFNGYEEKIDDYKLSRRYLKEQQFRVDFIALRNSLMQD